MNEFEFWNKKQNIEIKKMLTKANYVFAWVMTCGQDGDYLEIKKGSVREGIKNNPMRYDLNNFDLRTDGNLYIN
tara:strand:- start:772 stop:993 length:222 start_codon:yes stop_codon:yes gene_type:complete